MAPRRGGDGGAGAAAALPTAKGTFEPPPLKRMQPWLQDGSGQTDLLVGGVEDGIFKGVYMSGMHLMALMRSFAFSQAFLPVDMPQPVAELGEALSKGLPIVVVTRCCFGRDLDYGPGPNRNEMQKQVWELCRQMRTEMSQVLITCIDLPINCNSDVAQACLEEPLNQYRELMYHEGTWYAPQVVPAASLAKWKANDHAEKRMTGEAASKVRFQRKKFSWVNEDKFYQNHYYLGWKAVLEVHAKPQALPRTDLNFVSSSGPQVKAMDLKAPTGAETTFQKVASKAREDSDPDALLAAAKAYLDRAGPWEARGLDAAAQACVAARKLFEAGNNSAGVLNAGEVAVRAYLYGYEVDKAMSLAQEQASSAGDAVTQAKASRMVLECHYANGDLDKALEAATQARTEIDQKGSAEATSEAIGLVVAANLAKGDVAAAVDAAREAAAASDKAAKVRGLALLGEALVAKAGQSEAEEASSVAVEAATAFEEAKDLYKDLGQMKHAGEVLQSAISILLSVDDQGQKALSLAKELQGFENLNASASATKEALLSLSASGYQTAAIAEMQEFSRTGNFLGAGREGMLSCALQAVAVYEQAGDEKNKARAQATLQAARRAARLPF